MWLSRTYSLSNCKGLCVYNFIIIIGTSLKFSTLFYYDDSVLCANITAKDHPKKVMSSQSWKSGKAKSPFLSDRVTYAQTHTHKAICDDSKWWVLGQSYFSNYLNVHISITVCKLIIKIDPVKTTVCTVVTYNIVRFIHISICHHSCCYQIILCSLLLRGLE